MKIARGLLSLPPFFFVLLFLALLGLLRDSKASTFTEKVNIESNYRFSIFHKDYKGSSFRKNWKSDLMRVQHYVRKDRKRLMHFSHQINMLAHISGKVGSSNVINTSLSNGVEIYGEYYIPIYISSKNVLQYLIYDTGSDLVWVQCKECGKKCYSQVNKPYSLTASRSSKNLSCSECKFLNVNDRCSKSRSCLFSLAYGSGSQIYGTLARENFSFGSNNSAKRVVKDIIFGCATQVTKFDLPTGNPNVDGIAGFGISPISFPTQVARSLKGKNAFSVCLVSNSLMNNSELLIGSAALTHSNVLYTPILKKPKSFRPYFYVQVLKVSIRDKVLNIPDYAWQFSMNRSNGGTFLDSGTTNIYLTNATLDPIVKEVQSIVTDPPVTSEEFSDFSLCFYRAINSVLELNSYFPPITFTFKNNVNVTLLGYQYMNQVSSWVVCSGFQLNYDDFNVLGGYFQQDLLVVHDLENMKIGFKPMNCATGKPR